MNLIFFAFEDTFIKLGDFQPDLNHQWGSRNYSASFPIDYKNVFIINGKRSLQSSYLASRNMSTDVAR